MSSKIETKTDSYSVTYQDTTTNPVTWGTITAHNGWYGRADDSDEWSAWIENNPPVIRKSQACETHEWADTGLAKTWCKKCDISGRWVLGNVEVDKTK